LGGTLMEYTGMPHSWVDFYQQGFEQIILDYRLHPSTEDIQKSIVILKSFNARLVYREIEYTPQYIFEKVLKYWNINVAVDTAISSFFKGLALVSNVYGDTIPALEKLKEQGYTIATLTDLPTAMPDTLFKRDIPELLSHIDFYVSSLSCGYRKPNKAGLQLIADKYGVNITELIFIGDEEKDRLTAKNANCKFLLIDRIMKSNDADIHCLDDICSFMEYGNEYIHGKIK
jgi:putative hydrolase of the HAD superfamily